MTALPSYTSIKTETNRRNTPQLYRITSNKYMTSQQLWRRGNSNLGCGPLPYPPSLQELECGADVGHPLQVVTLRLPPVLLEVCSPPFLHPPPPPFSVLASFQYNMSGYYIDSLVVLW